MPCPQPTNVADLGHFKHAERMVWAVWRGGRLLRDVERNRPETRFSPTSDDRTQGFSTTIEAHGLKRDMAYRWIAVGSWCRRWRRLL